MTISNARPAPEGRSRLRRLAEGRILGGVAAGLAEYFDIDVAVVRVGFVALCLVGGMAIALYIAGWLLIPEAGTDSAIATDLLSHVVAPDPGDCRGMRTS